MMEDGHLHAWNQCLHCRKQSFNTVEQYTRHLREKHCSIEGGSFVCRYGYNSVCNSLPVEGVSDLDYLDHVRKHHVFPQGQTLKSLNSKSMSQRKSSTSSQISNYSDSGGQWSVYSASQNLAAVLNDPNKGKQRDFFTKTWGTDFIDKTLADIPEHPYLPVVDHSHFDNYLKKLSKRYRRHTVLLENTSASNEVLNQFPKVRLHRALSIADKSSSIQAPQIFLQQDFNITKADTFYQVFPFAKNGIWTNSFLQSGKLLQEKLTHDLDQIEVSIAEQVAQKSEAFFQAMTSHDALMEQLTKTLAAVTTLRKKMSEIDASLVQNSFHVLQLERRRTNHLLVYNKLKLINTVHQVQPHIQVLLSTADYVGALDLISTTQEILNQELQGILSFKHLGSQLIEMNRIIDELMMSEFQNYSTRDLNRPLDGDEEIKEEDKLFSVMLGLLRLGNFDFIAKYKDECFTTIRAYVKQVVFEAIAARENELEEGAATLEHASVLQLNDWVQLLSVITETLVKLLRRIKAVHQVMLDAIDTASGSRSSHTHSEDDTISIKSENLENIFLNEKDNSKLKLELKQLLISVCDFAHEQTAKLLLTEFSNGCEPHRNTSSSSSLLLQNATAAQVGKLSALVVHFTSECEAICGTSPTALRSGFEVHTSRFLSKFYQDCKMKIDVSLDREQWSCCDVPLQYQSFITYVVDSGNLLSADGSFKSQSVHQVSYITVCQEKFFIIGSVLPLIRIISKYCLYAEYLTSMSSQLLRNLSDLLTHFNARYCQLVLGSGARQTVGLKFITSAILALAWRSLQLILWLIPFIKNHFEELASRLTSSAIQRKKSTIAGLDSAAEKIKDHVVLLQNKLVEVVNHALVQELAAWEVKPPAPSDYFRNIARHLHKLHYQISPILPANQVRDIYKSIHRMFKVKLREHLHKSKIINNGGPQQAIVTSNLMFYSQALKRLDVLPDEELSEESLSDIWVQR